MTIALSFFFCLYSISTVVASSKIFEVISREQRESKTADSVQSVLTKYLRGAIVKQDKVLHEVTFLSPNRLRNGHSRVLAAIYENGNDQRISMYLPAFELGKATIAKNYDVRGFFLNLAHVLKPYAKNLGYIYIHGIVQPQEDSDSQSALQLSRARADLILSYLQEGKLVSNYTDKSNDATIYDRQEVPVKYAIAFGTGSYLYTSSAEVIGRVDLVLFQQDSKTSSR